MIKLIKILNNYFNKFKIWKSWNKRLVWLKNYYKKNKFLRVDLNS